MMGGDEELKGGTIMQWESIMALVIAIPIIILPVVFVWYLNIGGIHANIKEARARRVTKQMADKVTVKSK